MRHEEGILCSFVCSRFWWVWISPGNFWILWWVQFKSVQVPWKFHTCTFSQNVFFVSLFLCCASTGASIGGIACTQLIQNTYLHSHTSGPFCFMVQQSVVHEVRCQIVGRIMRGSCTATDSFQWFSVIPFQDTTWGAPHWCWCCPFFTVNPECSGCSHYCVLNVSHTCMHASFGRLVRTAMAIHPNLFHGLCISTVWRHFAGFKSWWYLACDTWFVKLNFSLMLQVPCTVLKNMCCWWRTLQHLCYSGLRRSTFVLLLLWLTQVHINVTLANTGLH